MIRALAGFIKDKMSTVLMTLLVVVLMTDVDESDGPRDAAIRVVDGIANVLKRDTDASKAPRKWSGSFSYQLQRTGVATVDPHPAVYGSEPVTIPKRLPEQVADIHPNSDAGLASH